MSLFPVRSPDSLGLKEVLYEKSDWIARVTINRPHNYNAYSTPALQELAAAFQDASWDDNVAVVVYTGTGDRAFCTGGDVKEYAEDYLKRPHDYWKYMGLFSRYIESIMNCGKVVVARLNGIAVGGGHESHMACDLSILGSHAYIGQVGSKVGSVACGGATQWLSVFIGERRARQMLFLNEPIPAQKCLEWGLINEVAPTVKKGDAYLDAPTPAEIKHKEPDVAALDLPLPSHLEQLDLVLISLRRINVRLKIDDMSKIQRRLNILVLGMSDFEAFDLLDVVKSQKPRLLLGPTSIGLVVPRWMTSEVGMPGELLLPLE